MALTMVTNMLLLHMLEVFEFLDANGRALTVNGLMA
jgi:hypothetical protein